MTNDSVIHSGRKLTILRQRLGVTREELKDGEGFPKVDLRTLARWEQNGIPPIWLKKISEFFSLEYWLLFDDRMSEEQFKTYLILPDELKKEFQLRYGRFLLEKIFNE